MGLWLGATSRYIKLFDYYKDTDVLYLPIGCFNDIFYMYPDKKLYKDNSVTVSADIESKISLRDYQAPIVNAIKKYGTGLFVCFCGGGKTECALACAGALKQKTLFISHTNDLLNQALNRCKGNTNCTTSIIANGKVDLSGDIVFATVQTLFKKLEDIPQDTFGFIVVDECHKIACNAETVGMFRNCIDYFAARYKLGVTATLHRADGLEMCIPKIMGDIIYEIKEDGNDYVGIYEGNEIVRFDKSKFQTPVQVNYIETEYALYNTPSGEYRDVFERNGMTISFAKLLSDIGNDKDRNKIIIDLANNLKGSTIILSDRVEQLKYLQSKIPNSVQIDGGTKKAIREQALKDVDNGKIRILLASYKLAKEGLDCKILENVIFATPIKDDAIVIQSVGRCQRPYNGKTIANVYDLIDDVSMLTRFLQKRRSVYRKKGWIINDKVSK